MAENEKMFPVKVITPDRVFYSGEAEMIEFSTSSGQIGVYKKHIPLTTVLSPGAVIIHEADGEKVAAVHAGFAEVLPDQVTLLAETAEWAEESDVARAEAGGGTPAGKDGKGRHQARGIRAAESLNPYRRKGYEIDRIR